MKQIEKVMCVLAIGWLFVVFNLTDVLAATVPSQGDFAYEIYDYGVMKMLKGPIGFVGGIACIVVGATFLLKQAVMPAVLGIFCGIAILKADTIVSSMGMLIP